MLDVMRRHSESFIIYLVFAAIIVSYGELHHAAEALLSNLF